MPRLAQDHLGNDNHIDAIVAPDARDVPATRLGDFRCVGAVTDYPAPNHKPHSQHLSISGFASCEFLYAAV